MKIVNGALFLLIIILTLNCFDYEEILVFSPDFSGYVDIKYDVPIYEDADRSLLSFLPVEEYKIKEKYARFLESKEFEIENFTFNRMKTDKNEFRGIVSYRVHFSDPRNLEYILIGKNKIQKQGGRLYFQRSFLSTASPDEDASRLSNNLYARVLQSFNNRNISFRIVFPWYYDLVTNLGSFTRPGIHNYGLSLEQTFNTSKPVIWNIEIKANPLPEAGF